MHICRSSSYVKYVSSCSPATSLCPNPDSLEMRLNSISDNPNNADARRRVTYLSSCDFMASPSSRQQNHGVFFHCKNHRLIDVYVPAISDAHPHGFIAVLQQLPAQWHLDVSKRHLQNHRLPDPSFERTVCH